MDRQLASTEGPSSPDLGGELRKTFNRFIIATVVLVLALALELLVEEIHVRWPSLVILHWLARLVAISAALTDVVLLIGICVVTIYTEIVVPLRRWFSPASNEQDVPPRPASDSPIGIENNLTAGTRQPQGGVLTPVPVKPSLPIPAESGPIPSPQLDPPSH